MSIGQRAAQKAAARAEDERQIRAGEATPKEINDRNALFGSLNIVSIEIVGGDAHR